MKPNPNADPESKEENQRGTFKHRIFLFGKLKNFV